MEGIIINKLCDLNFYPKLYNFNNEDKKEYLGMTLMGPDLSKLMKFTKNHFFEKDILIDIGLELINLLEYIHHNNIIHRDVKPKNIVWGLYSNSTIKNTNRLYLIDFGYADYIGKSFLMDNEKTFSRKGTREFLSINSHLFGLPSPNDDIESLIYTLLYISKLGLPWQSLYCAKKSKYKVTLEMKINFDYVEYCGLEFEFLAKTLEYLKKVNEEKKIVQYEVLKKIFEDEKKEKENSIYIRNYEGKFSKEINEEIEKFIHKEKDEDASENIQKLFEGYPINYNKFHKDLNNIQLL